MYIRERYHTDASYKISKILRARFKDCVNKNSKKSSAISLLGVSVEEFKVYIESMFLEGMSWENHGKLWHIDHVIPCCSFDLTNYEQQKMCFNYKNMQPLFAKTTIVNGIEYIGNLNKNKY